MDTLIGQNGGGPAVDKASLIKDSGIQTFMADVIEASRDVPVIVDFWAPWCGPCRQLGPALEKAVMAAKGAVKMVKIDIDKNPQIAQQMRIQSIPAVYAFRNGQPIDGFVGALPESQVKQFVQRLVQASGGGNPVEELLALAGESLEAGDFGAAEAAYVELLQHDPGNPKAIAGLARLAMNAGDAEAAEQILAEVTPDVANDPDIASVRAALDLAKEAGAAGESASLRRAVEADPDDHQARFDLSLALLAEGDAAGSIAELLASIKRDRKWNEEAARLQLLKVFEALGPTDPATLDGRRKLSSILFS
ncbi:thioredoxin [Zavarzinia sp. CC-PAN008]|uniref:thioredoxin n=1 Tax=Zavarzinia sp. CC-PAN008 TaxID=3243332 RepID=UPI003F748001